MTQPEGFAQTAQETLATVIPIRQHERGSGRDAEILDRQVGPGWEGLPAAAGRSSVRFESLVRQAPCGLEPTAVTAAVALDRASQLVPAARATLQLLDDEVITLSEALDADLGVLGFDELDSVAACVLAISSAPSATPAWGSRASADAAALVLELVGPDVQAASRAHDQIYGRFTEHVWEVSPKLLAAGMRRWRPLARHRLRCELRAASRTGTVPGALNRVVREIVAARVARAQLAPVRPLLAQHLGALDRGVLTDVDAATASLTVVRDLQRALGGLHDDERMERLLLADAFRAPELSGPARAIRTMLAAWACDVAAAGGRDALALDGDALASWSDEVEREGAALIAAIEHLELVRPGATLREAVDALVLRQHVASEALSDDLTPSRPARTRGAS